MTTATMSIGTEKIGTRVYVTGNTYAVKDRLKAAGCHWDGERRQWWIGAAKQAAIAAIVGGLDGQPAPKEDLSTRRVYGKVRYKERSYYVIGHGNSRVRLTVLDASIDFWADESACQWEKQYAPRQERGAYGRPTGREVYQTLGSIQRFVAAEKKARDNGEPVCAECGRSGELVRDLEDGCLKHRRCCDIEPN